MLTGWRQHISDGGILPSGGSAIYFWKRYFRISVASLRGAESRLERGITHSEASRILSVGGVEHQCSMITGGRQCICRAQSFGRQHGGIRILRSGRIFVGRHLPFLGRHDTLGGLHGVFEGYTTPESVNLQYSSLDIGRSGSAQCFQSWCLRSFCDLGTSPSAPPLPSPLVYSYSCNSVSI